MIKWLVISPMNFVDDIHSVRHAAERKVLGMNRRMSSNRYKLTATDKPIKVGDKVILTDIYDGCWNIA